MTIVITGVSRDLMTKVPLLVEITIFDSSGAPVFVYSKLPASLIKGQPEVGRQIELTMKESTDLDLS